MSVIQSIQFLKFYPSLQDQIRFQDDNLCDISVIPKGEFVPFYVKGSVDTISEVELHCYDEPITPPPPPSQYYNIQRSGTFTRNNCGAGYMGTDYIYVVPAGTYGSNISQADANQQAVDDVLTNGQAQANIHGHCVLIAPIYSEEFDNWVGSMPVGWTNNAPSVTNVNQNGDRIELSMTGSRIIQDPNISSAGTGINFSTYGPIKISIKVDAVNGYVNFCLYVPNGIQVAFSQLHIGINEYILTCIPGISHIGFESSGSGYPMSAIIDYVKIFYA